MSKIESLPFSRSHAFMIDLRDQEKELLDARYLVAVSEMENASCATLMCDGRILAIVGFKEIWEGVVEVFVVPSKYIPYHKVAFVRRIKRYLNNLQEDLGLHRMQTASLADEATDRWMQALGFVCEGTLVRYTSTQQNYRMWARYGDGA